MRIHRIHLIYLTMIISSLLMMGSCRQKDILFPEAGMALLDVRFEWPRIVADHPQGMTLWFFPLDEGGHIWRFDIAGYGGGPVELPYGNYTMISYNNDVSGISIANATSPEGLEATLWESDAITQSILPFFRACVSRLEFTPSGLTWTEEGITSEQKGSCPTLLCHPSKISTTYNVEVTDIEGAERIHKAVLTFHGVCQSLCLYDAQSDGKVLNITSPFESLTTDSSLISTFESFGPLPDAAEGSLEVTVTLNDRSTYKKTVNIADQLANQRDGFYVKIVIEGISIPDAGDSPDDNVGMQVGVDGWTAVTINYTVGLQSL